MGDFSHGWRRKCGLVALAMACVFTAGWVRSLTTEDVFFVPLGPFHSAALSSADQLVAWRCGYEDSGGELNWISDTLSHWAADFDERLQDPIFPGEGDLVDWIWISGLTIGETSFYRPYRRQVLLIIPYWLIVLSPTLLAAFLLLNKPRNLSEKQQPATSGCVPVTQPLL